MTIDYGVNIIKDDNSASHAAIPSGSRLLFAMTQLEPYLIQSGSTLLVPFLT